MLDRTEVLEGFKFKRVSYYKGGYIILSRFTKIELGVLTRMGKIKAPESPQPSPEPLKKEKGSTLQGKNKASKRATTGASKDDKA